MIIEFIKREWAQTSTRIGLLLTAVSTIAPEFAQFDVRFAYVGAAAGVLLMMVREPSRPEVSQPSATLPRPGRARLNKAVGGSAAAALAISLVAGVECKRNDPYPDIVGVQTVCYGETRVAMRHYSDAECADMLANGIADFAGPVPKRNPELPVTPTSSPQHRRWRTISGSPTTRGLLWRGVSRPGTGAAPTTASRCGAMPAASR